MYTLKQGRLENSILRLLKSISQLTLATISILLNNTLSGDGLNIQEINQMLQIF